MKNEGIKKNQNLNSNNDYEIAQNNTSKNIIITKKEDYFEINNKLIYNINKKNSNNKFSEMKPINNLNSQKCINNIGSYSKNSQTSSKFLLIAPCTLKNFCCGFNLISILWKSILSIAILIAIILFIIEDIKESGKRKMIKINAQGKIPRIDNSKNNSFEFCTNEDIKYFSAQVKNIPYGRSSDSESKRVKIKEEACEKINLKMKGV